MSFYALFRNYVLRGKSHSIEKKGMLRASAGAWRAATSRFHNGHRVKTVLIALLGFCRLLQRHISRIPSLRISPVVDLDSKFDRRVKYRIADFIGVRSQNYLYGGGAC